MMKRKHLLTAIMLLASAVSSLALRINEIRIDNFGADTDEYAELKGNPGENLDGVWYIVIGDHSGEGSYKGTGTVELALDLTGAMIPDDGYFLIGRESPTLVSPDAVDYFISQDNFENSENVTHLIVRGYTGPPVSSITQQLGDLAVDIDDDNDGVPNAELPWTEIIDAIGVITPSTEEFFYGAALGFEDIGPDTIYAPTHIYRYEDTGKWAMGIIQMNLPETKDTPGSPNPIEPTEPAITSFFPNYGVAGDTIVVTGVNLDTTESVTMGGISALFFPISETELEVVIPFDFEYGLISVTNESGNATSALNAIGISPETVMLIDEEFESSGSLGVFSQISLASAKDWIQVFRGGEGVAEANGYANGTEPASDDWLISPLIDLSDATTGGFHFISSANFTGPDLQVLISTDYAGNGDPTVATWNPVSATLSAGSYAVTDSGVVNLDSYAGQSFHIAFRYTSTGSLSGEGKTYRIHQFLLGADVQGGGGENLNPWIGEPHFSGSWVLAEGRPGVTVALNDANYPWVYSFEHGWMWVWNDGSGDLLLYQFRDAIGWTMTPLDMYPYLYVWALDGWAWYEPDSGSPSSSRLFYRFAAPAGWLTIP